MNIRNVWRVLLILFIVVVTALLAGCDNNDSNITSQKKPFTLAYIDQGWRLRIKHSMDGTSWTSAEGANPETECVPGITADDKGVMYLAVFRNAALQARFMMGLGPGIWDSSSRNVGDGHFGEIDSATSAVHVEGENWLVAYEHDNQAKVCEFSSRPGVRDFGNDVTPVSGVTNDNLVDRPAMVNRKGRLLISWLMENKKVQLVTGNIVSGSPVWDAGYMFNVSETGYKEPEWALALAQDGESFYLAIMREKNPEPDQMLREFTLFIYKSSDGLHWSKLTSRHLGARIRHAVCIAARSQNDILTIASSRLTTDILKFNGSSWTNIDYDTVFGDNALMGGYDLTLYVKETSTSNE